MKMDHTKEPRDAEPVRAEIRKLWTISKEMKSPIVTLFICGSNSKQLKSMFIYKAW